MLVSYLSDGLKSAHDLVEQLIHWLSKRPSSVIGVDRTLDCEVDIFGDYSKYLQIIQ